MSNNNKVNAANNSNRLANNQKETKFSQSILDKLNAIDISESKGNGKKGIYKNISELSLKEKRTFRQKRRNELDKIVSNIIFVSKQIVSLKQENKSKDLLEHKNELIKYMDIYLIGTELKVSTFYDGSDKGQINRLQFCFDCLNEILK